MLSVDAFQEEHRHENSLIDDDVKWSTVLGFLGRVFERCVYAKVQMGLDGYKSSVTLSGYQEAKVRWLNHKLKE